MRGTGSGATVGCPDPFLRCTGILGDFCVHQYHLFYRVTGEALDESAGGSTGIMLSG